MYKEINNGFINLSIFQHFVVVKILVVDKGKKMVKNK